MRLEAVRPGHISRVTVDVSMDTHAVVQLPASQDDDCDKGIVLKGLTEERRQSSMSVKGVGAVVKRGQSSYLQER